MGVLEMHFCINRRNEENVPVKGGGVQQRLPGGRKQVQWAAKLEPTVHSQSTGVNIRRKL